MPGQIAWNGSLYRYFESHFKLIGLKGGGGNAAASTPAKGLYTTEDGSPYVVSCRGAHAGHDHDDGGRDLGERPEHVAGDAAEPADRVAFQEPRGCQACRDGRRQRPAGLRPGQHRADGGGYGQDRQRQRD